MLGIEVKAPGGPPSEVCHAPHLPAAVLLEWGPHRTKPEWEAFWREAGVAPPHPADALIRVRFRAGLPGGEKGRAKVHDVVFEVRRSISGAFTPPPRTGRGTYARP